MGQVESSGEIITYSDAWSFRDFTGHAGIDIPDGTVVYASCFSQEIIDRPVFRENLIATFVRCNLTNCLIPECCTLKDCNTFRGEV